MVDDQSTLARLYSARETVALLMIEDPVYVPIFERIEVEIAAEEARGDPIAHAGAIVRLSQLRSADG